MAGIRALAESDPAVVRARRPLTMHLGPDQILVNLDVQFCPQLTAGGVEAAVDRLEEILRKRYLRIKHIFLEAEAITGGAAPRPLAGPPA